MKIINGRITANKIKEKLKVEFSSFKVTPILKIILVGNDPASIRYVNSKIKMAKELGVDAQIISIDNNIDENELINIVKKEASESTGTIVQLPLPTHIKKENILNVVPSSKDIDGLSNNTSYFPATARGIITLLKNNDYSFDGKIVGVVGQSNLVGKPVADFMEKNGAKKVLRFTVDTGIQGTENSDILIVAAGSPKLIKAENIKQDAVIIDVGINEIADEFAMKKIVGDVDKESVKSKVLAISPVPGGVGPMTIISLMMNLLDATRKVEYNLYNEPTEKQNKIS